MIPVCAACRESMFALTLAANAVFVMELPSHHGEQLISRSSRKPIWCVEHVYLLRLHGHKHRTQAIPGYTRALGLASTERAAAKARVASGSTGCLSIAKWYGSAILG